MANKTVGWGRWAVAGAWYGLIFVLSQAPGADSATTRSWLEILGLGDLDGLMRMMAHGFMFGVQALLVYRALVGPGGRRDRRWAVGGALAITLALAVADEVHQGFMPLRHGRPVDVVFDMLGAAVLLALAVRTRVGD